MGITCRSVTNFSLFLQVELVDFVQLALLFEFVRLVSFSRSLSIEHRGSSCSASRPGAEHTKRKKKVALLACKAV